MRILLLIVFLFNYGISPGAVPPPVQKTLDAFNTFNGIPREKIYLHTDRDVYRAGEDIYFRAYLLDAATNMPAIRSRYVYVELMNQQDSVLRRVKLQDFDSVFHGHLSLPDTLSRGNYVLHAYTYWMQNEGTDYHFRKHVRVQNPLESRVDTRVTYSRDDRGRLVASIQLKNHHGDSWVDQDFLLSIDKRGKPGKPRGVKTDGDGVLRVLLDSTDYSLHLRFKDDIPFRFSRRVYIPTFLTDFDVQFFPEGGSLLSGNVQRVAFKAVGQDGFSVSVSGTVYADTIPLVEFHDEHKGLGSFLLPVHGGTRYTARVRVAGGVEKTFSLPEPRSEGLGLSLSLRDSLLSYRVYRGEDSPPPGELYLLVHSRGIPLTVLPVDRLSGRLKLPLLPAGVAHGVLLDRRLRVHSDRLFFIPPGEVPFLQVSSDKASYDSRERVELSLRSDFPADSLLGSFSLSVVDSVDSRAIFQGDHVISNLLLVSDLKGVIEEPGYYLGDTTRLSHLDLLMLTHGWSRFDVGGVLSGRLPDRPFYLERGQVISGVVENYNPEHGVKDKKAVITREQRSAEMIFMKYYRGNNLHADLIAFRKENGYPDPDKKPSEEKHQGSLMLVSDKGHFQICLPDSAGRFHVDLAFLDSTTFKIGFANLKVKQRAYLKINVDREKFLPTRNLFLARQEIQEEEEVRNREHALRYFIENGEKVYLLDEVTVKKKTPQKFYSIHDHLAEKYNRFDSAQIANMEGVHLLDVIKKLPDIKVVNNQIFPLNLKYEDMEKADSITIPVFVNGFIEEFVWLDHHPKKYLLSVNRIRGATADMLAGERKRGISRDEKMREYGVIWVVTSDDTLISPMRPHSIKFTPLGISLSKEFYQPRYDVDSVRYNQEERDTRATLYWNPRLAFRAGEEKKIFFYTNDKRGTYFMVIEGITREGIPVRRVERILLK